MTNNLSFFNLVLNASMPVQIIIYFLVLVSIISWTIIFQRSLQFVLARKALKNFTNLVREDNIKSLYQVLSGKRNPSNMELFFVNSVKEYILAAKSESLSRKDITERVQRAMRYYESNEISRLEKNLSWLATIGSVSPYIGLLGTVWGVMHSFLGLSMENQVTLSAVAPGIAEALIATAVGLFVAIPAVVAYNRYTNLLNAFLTSHNNLQDKILLYLGRI